MMEFRSALSSKVEDLDNDGRYFAEKAGVNLNVTAHANINKASGKGNIFQFHKMHGKCMYPICFRE